MKFLTSKEELLRYLYIEKNHGRNMKERLLLPTSLYFEAKRRLEELTEVKRCLEERFEEYPEGDIHIHRRSVYNTQYCIRMDSKEKDGVYIPYSDMKKIKIYLQKKYDKRILKVISNEIRKLERFIGKSDSYVEDIRDIYSDFPPEVKKIINPVDMSDKDFSTNWESIPFQTKGLSRKTELFTEKGEEVRSKTELNIANKLYKWNIPYKYECPLTLSNGIVIYPDFTVLDVRRRREVYWEHRGMMDDREYAKNAVKRIKDYEQSGFFLGDKLIITEESLSCLLGTNEIDRVIGHYFT